MDTLYSGHLHLKILTKIKDITHKSTFFVTENSLVPNCSLYRGYAVYT